jgi:hypothetical protein
MTDPNGWKTPDVRAAEAALNAAVERAREAIAKAQQVSARLKQTRLSDGDLRQIEQAARAPGASPQLRALAERVDRGEFTWRQIVDGEAMADPEVRAAFEANAARLAAVYRKFEEGYSLDEVLESETGGRQAAPGASEDDDEGGTVLKHSSW